MEASLGMTKRMKENLDEINLELNGANIEYTGGITERATNKQTPDFRAQDMIIINPRIGNNKIKMQFELRGNNEITVVGGVDAITEFFELGISRKTENGYELGVITEEGIKRNPKSYKYTINVCRYKKEVTQALKRHFELKEEEEVYFYRPDIFLMNEEETLEFIRDKKHFNNFNKFAKHIIKKQQLFHEIFGIPYKLNYNLLTLIKIKVA